MSFGEAYKGRSVASYFLVTVVDVCDFATLQAHGQQHLLEGVVLAVPTFHAYGHSAHCQVCDCIKFVA